jgi:CRISPR system Cascade subunit CasA
LTAEHNTDTAKVLFDHIDPSSPGTISEAKAVKAILATMTFSLSCGKSELNHTSTAPSATSLMVIPLGKNLEETLIFSLKRQKKEHFKNDLPLWEQKPVTVEELKSNRKKVVAGYASLYTWQSRAIRLQPTGLNEGVQNIAFASGVALEDSVMRDPMLAYRRDEKRGWLTFQLGERGIWRDFDSLLPSDGKVIHEIIEHVLALTENFPDRCAHSILVIGQSNNKAKVEFWRMERFTLPSILANDTSIKGWIENNLNIAKQAQKILWKSCREFARHQISQCKREPESADIQAVIDQMPCMPWYWSSLERQFHRMLACYIPGCCPKSIEEDWRAVVKKTAEDAWNRLEEAHPFADAWTHRAFSFARPILFSQLKKIYEKKKEERRTENE